MKSSVENATEEQKLELLRAHPDLGDRTEMTEESENEQASAGLDNLSKEEYETFNRLNDQYRDKFGFPFIMAVKNSNPKVIRQGMKERLQNSVEDEFETALEEVHKIARFRLVDLIADDGS
jgi:2-oxo-4-hydroxy-4-carboxy-5-ureidoimidazoline decarboxylase